MNKRLRLRLQIVVVLVFFFLLGVPGIGQEAKADSEKDKRLQKKILAVYQSRGEEGVRDFMKEKKGSISGEFIVKWAESGVKEKNKEWLTISLLLAREKKNQKSLADVWYKMAEYHRLISKKGKAFENLEKALPIYLRIDDLEGQGKVYLEKGTLYFLNNYKTKAFEMYDKALLLFEKGEYPKGQGVLYLRKGMIYMKKGNHSKAIEMYDKSLPFFEKAGDLPNQGDVYYCKGVIYGLTREHSQAFEMYDKALHLYEKVGNLQGQVFVHKSKAETYLKMGENANAFEHYNKLLDLYKKSGNLSGQGDTCRKLGDIYLKKGSHSKAIKMYDKALTLFEKVADLKKQSLLLRFKGNAYYKNGDNTMAHRTYEKALTLCEKTGNLEGQGNIAKSIGDIYYRTDNYAKAIEMYEKALPFFEKTGDMQSQAHVYRQKGLIFSYTGNPLRSREMLEKAQLFLKSAGTYDNKQESNSKKMLEASDEYLFKIKESADIQALGSEYLNRGNIYRGLFDPVTPPDYKKALEMYNTAQHYFEKTGDPDNLGYVYLSKGDIYFETGVNDRALEHYNKALQLAEKTGNRHIRYSVSQGKVRMYEQTGHYQKALEQYDIMLSLHGQIGDIQTEAGTLLEKARLLKKMGKKQDAFDHFKEGIAKLEQFRKQTAFSEIKKTFFKRFYNTYRETTLFMLENKYHEQGFQYAESMKARAFLDRLAEGLVKVEKGIPKELLQKRDDLVTKLSLYTKEIDKTINQERSRELKQAYRIVEAGLEDLLVKIRIQNPLYASVRYPEPVTLEDMQKNVLKPGELLVHYLISSEKVYVFLVSKKDFEVVTLGVNGKEINRQANRYLLSIKAKDTQKMLEYGKKIYKFAVKQLEASIEKSKSIIIVPDGLLAMVPFESFVVEEKEPGKPVYLIEKHRIKYIRSASVLATLRKHYKRESKTKHFIGFGDPVYDYRNFNKGKTGRESNEPVKGDEIKEIHRVNYEGEGGTFSRLEASGQEVKAIDRLFRKHRQKSVVHLREKATEESAKAQKLKEFDYIHFACHGILGDGFQGLVLSRVPKAKEDGYLTLDEIMNCDYNAKLVILSACQTGTGKVEKGEGVTSLASAVMYAGTPAVAASLWNVSDIGTKKLMVKFYKNILEKEMSKQEALRTAKLEMIEGGKYSSPYYWSAFVMYGE